MDFDFVLSDRFGLIIIINAIVSPNIEVLTHLLVCSKSVLIMHV